MARDHRIRAPAAVLNGDMGESAPAAVVFVSAPGSEQVSERFAKRNQSASFWNLGTHHYQAEVGSNFVVAVTLFNEFGSENFCTAKQIPLIEVSPAVVKAVGLAHLEVYGVCHGNS